MQQRTFWIVLIILAAGIVAVRLAHERDERSGALAQGDVNEVVESATPLQAVYGPFPPTLETYLAMVPVFPTRIEVEVEAPVPAPAPAPAPVYAASAAQAHPLIPWYVPESHHDAYLQCLDDPQRFNRTDWIATKDWPVDEATYIADHEGGWDLCQFNTGGSGACGWFQLLRCPPDGLKPEIQIAGAYAKYLDGARNYPDRSAFWQHWYQWWER